MNNIIAFLLRGTNPAFEIIIIFCVIVIARKSSNIAYLRREIRRIETEYRAEKQQLVEEKRKIQDYRIQIKNNISAEMKQYYDIVDSVMNKYEQRAYWFISQILDEPVFKRKNLFVFPQVGLSSIITLSEYSNRIKKEDKIQYDIILRNITSKSVDFLICQKQRDYGETFSYMPVYIIEVDGPPHRTNPITMRNDQFKNQLFEKLDLKYYRIPVNIPFDIDKKDIQNQLEESLLHNKSYSDTRTKCPS